MYLVLHIVYKRNAVGEIGHMSYYSLNLWPDLGVVDGTGFRHFIRMSPMDLITLVCLICSVVFSLFLRWKQGLSPLGLSDIFSLICNFVLWPPTFSPLACVNKLLCWWHFATSSCQLIRWLLSSIKLNTIITFVNKRLSIAKHVSALKCMSCFIIFIN